MRRVVDFGKRNLENKVGGIRGFGRRMSGMKRRNNDVLVSTEWLSDKMKMKRKDDFVLIDSTWDLFDPNYDELYPKEHIKGSHFYDIDKYKDNKTDLPHMLPTLTDFINVMQKFKIKRSDRLVLYDRSGCFVASARVWWMFRYFGHSDDLIHVLDGGLEKWKAEGRELWNVEKSNLSDSDNQLGDYPGYECNESDLRNDLLRQIDTIDLKNELLIDARPKDRFDMLADEPRPNVLRGRIEGAVNIPHLDLMTDSISLDPDNPSAPRWQHFKPIDVIKQIFSKENVPIDAPNLVSYCGSGVNASVVSLALYLLGNPSVALYDGSWTEWARKKIGKTNQ